MSDLKSDCLSKQKVIRAVCHNMFETVESVCCVIETHQYVFVHEAKVLHSLFIDHLLKILFCIFVYNNVKDLKMKKNKLYLSLGSLGIQ